MRHNYLKTKFGVYPRGIIVTRNHSNQFEVSTGKPDLLKGLRHGDILVVRGPSSFLS